MAILINNQGGAVNPQEPLTSIEHQQVPYQIYALGLFYRHAEGVLSLSVAEEPGPRSNPKTCEIVRAHAPLGSLTVRFQIEREGDWPIVPSPEPQSANLVYCWSEIHVAAPQFTPDASRHTFAVAGTFVYLMKQPVWGPQAGLFAGNNPVAATPFFFVPASQFRPLV